VAKPALDRFVNEYHALLIRLDNLRKKKLQEMYQKLLKDIEKDYRVVDDNVIVSLVTSNVISQYLFRRNPDVFLVILDTSVSTETVDGKSAVIERAKVVATIQFAGNHVLGYIGDIEIVRTDEFEERIVEVKDVDGNTVKIPQRVPKITTNWDGKVYIRNDFDYKIEKKEDGSINVTVFKKDEKQENKC